MKILQYIDLALESINVSYVVYAQKQCPESTNP